MSTTFTPGPWDIESRFVGPLYVTAAVQADVDRSGRMEVAHVGADTFVQAQANARLIAAAPELYEALERLVANYRSDGSEGATRDIEIALSVLAKARGETP